MLADDDVTVASEAPVDTCVVWLAWTDSSEEIVVDIEVCVDWTAETEGVIVRLAGSEAFSTLVAGYALASRTWLPKVPAIAIRAIQRS